MRTVLHESTRLSFAADSLAGLSVGDALGAQYFMVGRKASDLLAGIVPPPVWEWTDDTEMACSVMWMLQEAGAIDPDRLAESFAHRCEPNRGYGGGAFTILRRIRQGVPWRQAAAEAFDGQGSCGNGAAMRVAPVGAYFPDSPRRAADEAAKSARVTHAHAEGIAGAIAVAVAASVAAGARLAGTCPKPGPFLDSVLEHSPQPTAKRATPNTAHPRHGGHLRSRPLAARFLDDFPGAVKACVEAGGDADTTAAIVGSHGHPRSHPDTRGRRRSSPAHRRMGLCGLRPARAGPAHRTGRRSLHSHLTAR